MIDDEALANLREQAFAIASGAVPPEIDNDAAVTAVAVVDTLSRLRAQRLTTHIFRAGIVESYLDRYDNFGLTVRDP